MAVMRSISIVFILATSAGKCVLFILFTAQDALLNARDTFSFVVFVGPVFLFYPKKNSLFSLFINVINGHIAIASETVAGVCRCHDTWVAYNGSCYLFGHNNSVHFTETEVKHY